MYKLGRNKRSFGNVPHMNMIMSNRKDTAVPETVDWSHNIQDFTMMLNSTLGDCTCAAIFHAIQIWTANTTIEETEPDQCVLKLYENACGYDPENRFSDQGGDCQKVLAYCVNIGVPFPNDSVDKFLGFIEIDQKNIEHVKIAINEFGGVYLGIDVPVSIYDINYNPKSIWAVEGNSNIEGGHCIFAIGYDAETITIISWGQKYKMTWEFFSKYCEEAYAIISQDWIETSGKTPLGLTTDELENIANSIKTM